MYKDYVSSILNCRKFEADKGSNGGGDSDPEGGGSDGDPESGEKTFTQEDVNNLISKTKLDNKEKNKLAIKEAVSEALKNQKLEWEKDQEFSKLSDKKKQEILNNEREKELSDREAAVKLSEYRIEVKSNLQEQNLDPGFADMVIPADLNPEKTMENIAAIKKFMDEGIKAGVETGLASYKAKDTSGDNSETDIGSKYAKSINADQNTIPEGTWK